jgi:hypothetical protein
MTERAIRLSAQVERIRTAIIARRGGDIREERLSSSIERVSQVARVDAHWGISDGSAYIGPAIVFVRRVQRLLLRWYINPIVDQQNAFNDAVVRALHDLQAENDALHIELQQLRRQLDGER